MILDKHDKYLLFDFLSWLANRMEIKVDYLKLIKEFEEYRKGH